MVRTDMKGHGVGFQLMKDVLTKARERGLKRIVGYVLWENRPMLLMASELASLSSISRRALFASPRCCDFGEARAGRRSAGRTIGLRDADAAERAFAPCLTVADQSEVFSFLSDPATYGLTTPVQRVDTHGAAVFLAGGDAYKVKRAVRFPFMDFSTLEKRRAGCRGGDRGQQAERARHLPRRDAGSRAARRLQPRRSRPGRRMGGAHAAVR